MSFFNSRNAAAIAAAVFGALYGPLALAQSTAGQPAPGDSAALEEVVVTANRTEQNLQKVGAAVQVLSGEELSSQAITNIGTMFADTPSVNITAQPAGFSINIRGQMGDGPSGKQEGAVASEFDGIYNITALETVVGFFDMDRIEVLPGPQSTQYGPNADGGVVNAVSKDPVFNNWDGDLSVTYGNYNLRRGEFGQNLGLGDNFAIRVSGAFIDRGSYVEPENDNQIAQSGRVKVLWQLNDKFSIKAWVQMDHEGGTGQGIEPILFGSVPAYPGSSINNSSYSCNQNNIKQYPGLNCGNPWDHGTTDDDGTALTGHADLYETTYAAKLTWQFSDTAVVDETPSMIVGSGSQTGLYNFGCGGPGSGGYNVTSANYNPGCIYSESTQYPFSPFHEFANEVRVHSAPGNSVVWSAGWYLWNYKDDQFNVPGQTAATGNYSATITNAVFADITYPVTSTFRVIVGGRESGDERSAHQVNGPTVLADTLNFNHFDYRVGEQLDIGRSAMEYFTLSTGYRPGTINYQGNTNAWYTSGNEVNNAAELGLKSRWLDDTLQVNADAFYYFEDDYQENDNYTQYLPQGYEGITTTTGNSNICYTQGPGATAPAVCNLPLWQPDVRAYGFETQIKYDLTRDDRFSFQGTFEKSVFQAPGGGCAKVGYTGTIPAGACEYGANLSGPGYPQGAPPVFVNIQGEQTAHTPEFAANIGYDHIFHIGGYALDAGGTAFYSDWYWAHPVLDPPADDIQPAYWLFNASLQLVPAKGGWSLDAYIRNITDYAVKESYQPSTTLGDPRTFGLTANYRW